MQNSYSISTRWSRVPPKILFILVQIAKLKLSQKYDTSKKHLFCARLLTLEPCIPAGQMAVSQGMSGEFFLIVVFFVTHIRSRLVRARLLLPARSYRPVQQQR